MPSTTALIVALQGLCRTSYGGWAGRLTGRHRRHRPAGVIRLQSYQRGELIDLEETWGARQLLRLFVESEANSFERCVTVVRLNERAARADAVG